MHPSWVWYKPLYGYFSLLFLALDRLGSCKSYGSTCPWKLLQLKSHRFMSAQIYRAVASPALRGQTPDFPWLRWPSLSIYPVQSIHLFPYRQQVGLYCISWLVSRIPPASYPFAHFSMLSQQRNGYMAKESWDFAMKVTDRPEKGKEDKSIGWQQGNLSRLKCTLCQDGLLFFTLCNLRFHCEDK